MLSPHCYLITLWTQDKSRPLRRERYRRSDPRSSVAPFTSSVIRTGRPTRWDLGLCFRLSAVWRRTARRIRGALAPNDSARKRATAAKKMPPRPPAQPRCSGVIPSCVESCTFRSAVFMLGVHVSGFGVMVWFRV